MATQSESYPARLNIDYPEKLDRFTSFFRLIAAIPILIVLSVLSATSTSTMTVVTRTGEVVSRATSTGGGIATALFGATLLMILFRRRYPRWWFDFAREFARFGARVGAYLALLTDRYPSTVEEQAVHLEIDYPDVEARPQPLAAVGEVVPRHPPLHRARLPRDRRPLCDRHRLVRHPLHRPLSQGTLRLRGRGRQMGTAGAGVCESCWSPTGIRPSVSSEPDDFITPKEAFSWQLILYRTQPASMSTTPGGSTA